MFFTYIDTLCTTAFFIYCQHKGMHLSTGRRPLQELYKNKYRLTKQKKICDRLETLVTIVQSPIS